MEFPWPFLGDIGLGAIVVLFVLAILTGRLVPANVVREVRDDRDLWRDTALTREDSFRVALETVKETHEASQMILDIVRDLRYEGNDEPPSRAE